MSIKYLSSISIILVLFVSSVVCAQQHNTEPDVLLPKHRVALVIGNSAYKVSPLSNPVNDAQDMARVLSDLGFEVIHKENVTQNDMKRAIRSFGEKIRNGGVGLFYYAGHGVQVSGQNYLIPVGAVIENEEDVEYESVDVRFVLAQVTSAGNEMNILILDACRNNPFASSLRSPQRGLAVMTAPSGTFIAYATAPGSVASDGNTRNGLYTEELLKYMQMTGLAIEEVFKRVRLAVRNATQGRQVPWESTSLVRNFYFSERSTADVELPSQTVTSSNPDADGFYLQGINFMIDQKYSEAEAILKKAVKIVPSSSSYHELLGLSLFRQEKYQEAESEFRLMVSLKPNDRQSHHNLGSSLFKQQKYTEAETEYRKAVRLDPNNTEYQNDLGTALFNQNKYKEAEMEYRIVVRLEPNNAMYRHNLGSSLFKQQKYAEAETEYRKAVQLDPNDTEYQNDLTLAEKMKQQNSLK